MSLIQVEHLIKEFTQVKQFSGLFGSFRSLITRQKSVSRAVDDVSFSIEKGEAVGYLGPNGAGKSTMIKMLTGILVPTSGNVRVAGRTPHLERESLTRRFGVVFGQRSQLWWDLPVIDSFELHRYMYKMPLAQYERNIAFFTESLDMGPYMTKPVRQLSLGQRMRAEISLALLHDPEILFLDEPTIGLDVMAKDRIREFLRVVNREREMTIILTSHDMRDIEEICSRLIIVSGGKSIYDGSVQDLKAQIGVKRNITIEFAQDPGKIELYGATLVDDRGKLKTFVYKRDSFNAFEMLAALSGKHPIVDVTMENSDIEDVIRTLYRNIKDGSYQAVQDNELQELLVTEA